MPSYYRDPHAPTPNAPRSVEVVAILERGDTALVQRRADDGQWDFLGGAVEDYEAVLDALTRELREEAGLRLACAGLFGVFSDPTRIGSHADGTVRRYLSIVFRCQAESGEPDASDESLELRFVTPAELGALEFWPAVRPIRDAFLRSPAEPVIA